MACRTGSFSPLVRWVFLGVVVYGSRSGAATLFGPMRGAKRGLSVFFAASAMSGESRRFRKLVLRGRGRCSPAEESSKEGMWGGQGGETTHPGFFTMFVENPGFRWGLARGPTARGRPYPRGMLEKLFPAKKKRGRAGLPGLTFSRLVGEIDSAAGGKFLPWDLAGRAGAAAPTPRAADFFQVKLCSMFDFVGPEGRCGKLDP